MDKGFFQNKPGSIRAACRHAAGHLAERYEEVAAQTPRWLFDWNRIRDPVFSLRLESGARLLQGAFFLIVVSGCGPFLHRTLLVEKDRALFLCVFRARVACKKACERSRNRRGCCVRRGKHPSLDALSLDLGNGDGCERLSPPLVAFFRSSALSFRIKKEEL